MCEPTTAALAYTAIAATVAGTAVSVYGQYQQGKYQSKVAKNNAIIQNRLAEDALARGRNEEQQHRLKVAAIKGKQRAQLAANGVDIQSGSALNAISDTAMMGELDALTIRSNAQREAYGYRAGAANSIAQGRLDQMAGNWGAASTLLSGSGQVASTWYAYKKG